MPYIEKGGIFSKLKTLAEFKHFEVNRELGVLTWNNEIDIAPETLYADATGDPLPDWMQMDGIKQTARKIYYKVFFVVQRLKISSPYILTLQIIIL